MVAATGRKVQNLVRNPTRDLAASPAPGMSAAAALTAPAAAMAR